MRRAWDQGDRPEARDLETRCGGRRGVEEGPRYRRAPRGSVVDLRATRPVPPPPLPSTRRQDRPHRLQPLRRRVPPGP